jgi:hypothetical protein
MLTCLPASLLFRLAAQKSYVADTNIVKKENWDEPNIIAFQEFIEGETRNVQKLLEMLGLSYFMFLLIQWQIVTLMVLLHLSLGERIFTT